MQNSVTVTRGVLGPEGDRGKRPSTAGCRLLRTVGAIEGRQAVAREGSGVPAYQDLAERLRHQIVGGELSPGEQLPVEPELSSQHGVSRSTVREALRLLSSQNLIITTRGVAGGTFVAHPRPEQISEYLEASLGLLARSDGGTVGALLEVRELLEVPAAGLAARRRTAAHLADLRRTLEHPLDLPGNDRYPYNRDFHAVLLRAAGNPLLEVVTGPVFRVLNTRFLRDVAPARFWKRVDEDHGRIIEAVQARDASAAEETTAAHLRHLRSTYVRMARARRENEPDGLR